MPTAKVVIPGFLRHVGTNRVLTSVPAPGGFEAQNLLPGVAPGPQMLWTVDFPAIRIPQNSNAAAGSIRERAPTQRYFVWSLVNTADLEMNTADGFWRFGPRANILTGGEVTVHFKDLADVEHYLRVQDLDGSDFVVNTEVIPAGGIPADGLWQWTTA